MSCIFHLKSALIFTGSVDGALVAWNLDTGFARYHLHERDPTMKSEEFIKDSKSVDCLVIMEQHEILVSMTAD